MIMMKEMVQKPFSIDFEKDFDDDNFCGAYTSKTLYYDEYIPANGQMVMDAINKRKEKGYGLR